MLDTTLVVMAAGIGNRFGGGIKQLEPVGPHGELLIDYAIFDALQAGFNKVVFVIREDLERDVKAIIGNRIAEQVKVEYAYQRIEDVPDCYLAKAKERKKPWGTGQAILCCKHVVNEPFLVINADDYYGKDAYQKVYSVLTNQQNNSGSLKASAVGFVLKNTLSEHGTVTRGICDVSADGELLSIEEIYEIARKGDIAVGKRANKEELSLRLDSVVSMNMWGLYPDIFKVLEEEFESFLEAWNTDMKGDECLLPILLGDLLKEHRIKIDILHSSEEWFGVTYKEDKDFAKQSLQKIIEQGSYPRALYE